MTRTLSLDEAADVLKTTPETVSDCIHQRGLPAAKIGRAWVLVDDDVISWLRAQYRNPHEQRPRPEAPAPLAGRAYKPSAELQQALAPQRRPSQKEPRR